MNGLVLAGGQSSRMGKDKALIDYHGQPQFLHIYKLLENLCDQVYISSKEKKYSLPTLIDSPELESLGPIAGIISAFEWEDNDWLVVAIDYPLFSEEHILKLIEPTDTLANVYFNPETGFFEPFLALYKQAFKETLMSEISTGTNSLQTILRKSLVTKVIPKNLEVIKSVDYPKER